VAEQERDEGRCVNCGLLGRRAINVQSGAPAITPAYYEADNYQRQNGDVFSQFQSPGTANNIRTDPFCFLGAADIMQEIGAASEKGTSGLRAKAKEVFAKSRNCKSWYRYNPGLSPKDHFDQMNMELLEKSRREWEMRLETERKDFDFKLFEASQKIQESNRQIAADSYKTTRRSFWFTLFSTGVIVLLTLISLFLTLLQVWLAMRQTGSPMPFQEWFNWLGFKSFGG